MTAGNLAFRLPTVAVMHAGAIATQSLTLHSTRFSKVARRSFASGKGKDSFTVQLLKKTTGKGSVDLKLGADNVTK